MRLEDYLAELRSLPPETPLEPELKPQRVKLDKKIREEQDLAAGAVLTAVLEEGEGGPTPQEGDLVYIQYSIRDLEDDLLYTTRSEEGGSGQAFAFLVEKGVRVPRSWEIAIKAMTRGQRNVLQVKPGYGFRHPDCTMRPPLASLPTDQVLRYDIELVSVYPGSAVHHYNGTGPDALLKRHVRDGTSWESPRPPFEVTIHLTACCPAYNGLQMTGQRIYSTRDKGRGPLTLQLGQGLLPPAVESALGYMSRDEVATFVASAAMMQPSACAPSPSSTSQAQGSAHAAAAGGSGRGPLDGEDESSGEEGDVLRPGARGRGGEARGPSRCLLPAPPARCCQVEFEVELVSMVQVRDVTGTGEVTKKRLKEGAGEFPIDCPLHDTTVRVHYRARRAAHQHQQQEQQQQQPGEEGGDAGESSASVPEGAGERPWLFDSRSLQQEPLSIDTGCGELPEGLEMTIKLMVPGEVSAVVAQPRYAYAGREDCPAGISGQGDAVEFEVELFDFEREGHWQNLSFEERYVLADRLKAKGNELFKKQKFKFARARYERLLRMLESTRDFDTDEQVSRIDGYKVAVLGNLALCCSGAAEYAAAVAFCEKALEYEPENAKLHFRRGKALSLKGDYEEAEDALKIALEYDASIEKEVKAELAANSERHKAAMRKQRKEFGNFLKR